MGEVIHLSDTKNEEKCEHGFLQVDNQILDLLLCDTKLNVYGILILSKIREYQRKKIKCFVSNVAFAKLYKTSESMIKRQMNELYDLGLIESVVVLNPDGTRGKLRTLRTPRNFQKVLDKILSTKDTFMEIIKGQNTPLYPQNDPRKPPVIKGQNQGSTPNFDPRNEDNIKGHFIGSKLAISSGHSDPITIEGNNSPINNRFLEDNNTLSSLASSHDDFRNDNGVDSAIIPGVNSDAIQNPTLDTTYGEDESMKKSTYPNERYDEMKQWFTTELNPISRYNYEIKYGDNAMLFAWGERERKDNQQDYYTPSQIVEYFRSEKNIKYLEQIQWAHIWMAYLDDT